LEARRLLLKTYADELVDMVKEFIIELGIDVVQPDEAWEPSDTESNDGQGTTIQVSSLRLPGG